MLFFPIRDTFIRLKSLHRVDTIKRATPGLCITHIAEKKTKRKTDIEGNLISLILVTCDYNKTPMVVEVK